MSVQTIASDPQASARMSARTRDRLLNVISPLALLMVWELCARFGFIDTRFFPAPSSVIATMIDMLRSGELITHTAVSLQRLAYGIIVGGLLAPTSGTVDVAGTPVRGPLPRHIAFVFQENALFPWNTVMENVELGMRFQGVPQSEHMPRAKKCLEAVGLADFANHYPGQLSGGMRQRAALARALALETGILLMDEPFGALDEQTRMILGEDLSVLLARTGKTIVFVTHSLGEAVFLADRVGVFSARPGTIKKILRVDEPHPRDPNFAKHHGIS